VVRERKIPAESTLSPRTHGCTTAVSMPPRRPGAHPVGRTAAGGRGRALTGRFSAIHDAVARGNIPGARSCPTSSLKGPSKLSRPKTRRQCADSPRSPTRCVSRRRSARPATPPARASWSTGPRRGAVRARRCRRHRIIGDCPENAVAYGRPVRSSAARASSPAPTGGSCTSHLLEHEDMGMMRPFAVMPPQVLKFDHHQPGHGGR
jgi:hypothetical protein